MKLQIYLARHGQTDWNAEMRLQGWTDTPLNATGRKQAEALAIRLKNASISRIYCSALKRSFETAQIISSYLNCPVAALSEFNEQSLGSYEGQVLQGELQQEFHQRRSDPNDTLDGGESRAQHLQRVQGGLEKIMINHPGEDSILIVGHGGTNNAILRAFFNDMDDVTFRFQNVDLFVIQLKPDSPPAFSNFADTTAEDK